jgi:hypothetical protein
MIVKGHESEVSQGDSDNGKAGPFSIIGSVSHRQPAAEKHTSSKILNRSDFTSALKPFANSSTSQIQHYEMMEEDSSPPAGSPFEGPFSHFSASIEYNQRLKQTSAIPNYRNTANLTPGTAGHLGMGGLG